jgi:Spy/CpxP family protein refolding chaperone
VNTWKVILATMLIFGTGVVTGGFLVRSVEQSQAHHSKRPPGETRAGQPWSPGGMRLEFLRRVQADLDLTPEQRECIDRILKDSQERTRKLMEPVAPRLREEFQKTKEEFRAVLTPEQLKRFDELSRQQQQHPQKHPSGQRFPALTNAPAATTNL